MVLDDSLNALFAFFIAIGLLRGIVGEYLNHSIKRYFPSQPKIRLLTRISSFKLQIQLDESILLTAKLNGPFSCSIKYFSTRQHEVLLPGNSSELPVTKLKKLQKLHTTKIADSKGLTRRQPQLTRELLKLNWFHQGWRCQIDFI